MSTTDRGTIVEVSISRLGDELAVDAALGATTLTVYDVADFHEDGGTLSIGTEVVEYSATDDETATITLATGLLAAHAAGDRVDIYPESLEKSAQVMVGDADEAVQAIVPHALWDRIPEGVRDEGAGEVVDLELVGTDYIITNVVGAAPTVDGTYIDPDTIPTVDTSQLEADLAQLQTDLHGPGGLDEQLTAVNSSLHGPGGVDEQLAGLDTDLHGAGGVDEQLGTIGGKFPVSTVDIALGAVTADRTSALSADKITAGTLAADRIAANSLTGDKIIANTLAGDRLIANTVQGDRIIANTLSGDRVIANTMNADRIVAGSITTDRMTANSINGDRILANTLSAAKIVAGSIGTDRMTANTINGDRIAANTLDAAKIVAGSITTDRMTANTISGDRIAANTLDAAKIVAGSITTDRMTANTINGDRIQGGTISADKLSATAIDGKTITGSLLRTAASGRRIQVGGSSYVNQMMFYSGLETGTVAQQDAKAGALLVDGTDYGLPGAPVLNTQVVLTAPDALNVVGPQLRMEALDDLSQSWVQFNDTDQVSISTRAGYAGAPTFDAYQFDAVFKSLALAWGGKVTGIQYGYFDQNTDTNGRIQIGHDLGNTPGLVLAFSHSASGTGYVELFSKGTTSFQLTCRGPSGTVNPGGTRRTGHWLAFR